MWNVAFRVAIALVTISCLPISSGANDSDADYADSLVGFLERIGPGEDLWSLDPNDIYDTVITSIADYQRRHTENPALLSPDLVFAERALPVVVRADDGDYWIDDWALLGLSSELREESEIKDGDNVFLSTISSIELRSLDPTMLALGEVISQVLPYAEVEEPDSIRRAMESILNSETIKLVVTEPGMDTEFDRDFEGREYLLEISYSGDRFARVSLRHKHEFSSAVVRF